MEQLLFHLIEKAKKNKKGLIMLKNAAVLCQEFKLASELRQLEKTFFPETEEEKGAKKHAQKIDHVLRMVEINLPYDVCWLISKTLKTHSKMNGKFSIKEAAELLLKRKELFEERF